MIAKRVTRKSKGSFRHLAEYIVGAKEAGEKLGQFWIVNADAGETLHDLDMAICEIEAKQALNTRMEGDKSYHLIVSFRDELPSPAALRDIEQEFAKALGFDEHQRIAAMHHNTDNHHLHIAFSKIHPKTKLALTPHQDFRTLEKTCRLMEKKHSLKADLGRNDKIDANQKPQSARDMEAHTWEQSFYSYVQGYKNPLLNALNKAKDWQDLHTSMAEHNLVLRKRGNGLIIGSRPTNQYTKAQHIKASALDRSFSKGTLEKRFGPFQGPTKTTEHIKATVRYKRTPITHHPDQATLWHRYLKARNRPDTFAQKTFNTWREYLSLGAIDDPLAIAIIQSHKKIIQTLTLQKTKPNKKRPSNLER